MDRWRQTLLQGVDLMTKRPTKYEPPLALDMDFGEALSRFGQTEKNEADELADKARTKKKPPKPKEGNGG